MTDKSLVNNLKPEEQGKFRGNIFFLVLAILWFVFVFGTYFALNILEYWPRVIDLLGG